MRIWAIILAVAVGTYAMRASLLVALARVTIPPRIERGLRYIGPAVMAAIVAPAVLAPDGALVVLDWRPVAALVAGVVAWRWRKVPLTLAAGLGTYYAAALL